MPQLVNDIPNLAVAIETYEAVAAIYGTYGLPTPGGGDTAAQANGKRIAILQKHIAKQLTQTLRDYREQKARQTAAPVADTDIT